MKVQGRCAPWTVAIMLVCLVHISGLGKASPDPFQGQLVSVGILSFQDDSGLNAPPEFGQKIAQEVQQKLVVSYKDLLPRVISAGTDAAAIKGLTVDQLVTLGKQNGLKFIVRGGLLAISSESAGEETKTSAQLYAEIISVDTANVSSVRAEGIGAQKGPAPDTTAQLGSTDFRSNEFRASALGQALSSAIEQLATSVHQAVTATQTAATSGQTQTGTETGQAGGQATSVDAQAAQAAEADAELQQLIAQAEALLASNSTSSTENLSALSQALEGVKTALASKTSLMEQSQDTAPADQQLAARQQELQAAMNKATEEAATSETTSAEAQPTGEKKGFMARIDDFAGQSLSLLQKIQEMRAALRGLREEQSASPTGETGETGVEAAMPSEAPAEEVSGVVTEDGSPVEGAVVTDEESGMSTTTDSSGSYTLQGLISGKLAKLIVSQGQKKMSAQVEVFPGRANVADLQFKKMSAGAGMPALTILPSTVVLKGLAATAGQVKGVVRDEQGHPVARALVTLKGLGVARAVSPGEHGLRDASVSARQIRISWTGMHQVSMNHSGTSQAGLTTSFSQGRSAQTLKNIGVARTNSLGQYAFLNVPAGPYQLTINRGGLRMKSAQVEVGPRKIAGANFNFSRGDVVAKLPATKRSLILPGSATVLGGTVLDNQNRPVAGAKVSAVQSESVISVFTPANGTFELRNLKPGTYRVAVYKVGYDSTSENVALRSGGVEQRAFKLKKQTSPLIASLLKNDATRRSQMGPQIRNSGRTQIGTQNSQLMGRVTDFVNGKPLSGVSVVLQGQSSIKTDEQGNYRIEALAPGNYQLMVKRSGYIAEARTITVRSNVSTRHDFALRSERPVEDRTMPGVRVPIGVLGGSDIRKSQVAGQVTGQVSDAKTGKPISGVTVLVPGQRNVLTDQQGRFVVANLTPGSYQISVSKSGFAQAQGTVNVRAGETATANFNLNPIVRPPVRLRLP